MLYFYNIRMTKQPKEFNFSQNTCGIRNMLKNIINLLDCNPFSSMRVNCRANNTITTFSNDFLYLVLTSLSILGEEICLCRALYKESNLLVVNFKLHNLCRETRSRRIGVHVKGIASTISTNHVIKKH